MAYKMCSLYTLTYPLNEISRFVDDLSAIFCQEALEIYKLHFIFWDVDTRNNFNTELHIHK